MPEKYRARIPDEDAYGWMKTLHEGGFTGEEIDQIMMRLNDTYVEKKSGTVVVDRLVEEAEDVLAKQNVEITEELRQQLREWVIEKIRKESQA